MLPTSGSRPRPPHIDALRASILATLLAALLVPAIARAAIEFIPPVSVPAGGSVYAFATGDLNGDSRRDIVAIVGSATAKVMLQSEDGSFATTQTLPASGAVRAALLDVDGDHDLDLVLTSGASDGLPVFVNDGAGNFSAGAPIAVASGYWPLIVAADFDNDGDSDLAVAGPYDSSASLVTIRNTGSGFVADAPVPIPGYALDLEAGDLNGDGFVDLALGAPSRLVKVLNQGGLSFAAPEGEPLAFDGDLALGDVDGDGDLDVVGNEVSGSIHTYLNDGNGGFTDMGQTLLYGQAPAIAMADFDADGRADVVAASPDLGTATVRHSHGDGTYDHPTLYFSVGTQNRPYGVATADMDGDGRPDIVTSNTSSAAGDGGGSIAVLINGRLDRCGRKEVATGAGASYVDAADLDADGDLDLAVVNEDQTLSVLLRQPDGEFAAPVNYLVGGLAQSFTFADVNTDSRPDLVAAGYSDNSLTIYRNLGDGTFAWLRNLTTGQGPRFVAAADLNGDGAVDLVSANYGDSYNAGSITIYFGDGAGAFPATASYPAGVGPYEISIGDLNGDAQPDLVVNNYDGQTVSVFLNTGNGHFAPQVQYGTGWDLSTAIADLDKDGDNDLAIADFKEHSITILRNNGNGTFSGREDMFVGVWPRCIVPTVLSKDGSIDLALVLASASQVVLLKNDGTGHFAALDSCQIGVNPKTLSVMDVDKNGGLDLITANTGAGTVTILSDVAPAWSSPAAVANAKRPRNLGSPRAGAIAYRFELSRPTPNPIADISAIRFEIPGDANVDLRVFDVAGRTVRVLVRAGLPAGDHEAGWNGARDDGSRAPSGVYFVRLRAGSAEATRTVVLN
jgi:hypothetical protein